MQLLKQKSASATRFIERIAPRISIADDFGALPYEHDRMKLHIARSMLDVQRFSRGIGVRIFVDGLDGVIATKNIIPEEKEVIGAYENGVIYLKNTSSKIIAHEMFHLAQHQAGNMPYYDLLDKSYVEGGAYLFESAFSSSLHWYGNLNFEINDKKVRLFGDMGNQELNKLHTEFLGLRRKGRQSMLLSLLSARDESRAISADAVNNGSNFASFARILNNLDTVRTIKLLLNTSPYDAILILKETGNWLAGKAMSAMVRSALTK